LLRVLRLMGRVIRSAGEKAAALSVIDAADGIVADWCSSAGWDIDAIEAVCAALADVREDIDAYEVVEAGG